MATSCTSRSSSAARSPASTRLGRRRSRGTAALERAVALLHFIAGVSYYKTCFAPEISVETDLPDPDLAAFLHHLYTRGLAECRFVNDLRGREIAPFPSAAGATPKAGPAGLGDRPLGPIGGGTDSIVTLEGGRGGGRA